MQELGKVLDELEQYRKAASDIGDFNVSAAYEKSMSIIREHMNDGKCGDCGRRKWYQKGYEDGRENNDRWIPVEERLPENSGYYRVTTRNTELGDITEETAWFAHVDDYVMDESEWRELYEYEEVIAWRELDPYNPERSNNAKE